MGESLKDFFGTPAIDYGTYAEMCQKYTNSIFIFVTNDPIANEAGYVLEIGVPEKEDVLENQAKEYRNKMRKLGHKACMASVVEGENITDKKLDGFIGGIGV